MFYKANIEDTDRNIILFFCFFIVFPFLFFIVVLPCLLIWSLNTLFLLQIPYNFFTWLATLILLTNFSKIKIFEIKLRKRNQQIFKNVT